MDLQKKAVVGGAILAGGAMLTVFCAGAWFMVHHRGSMTGDVGSALVDDYTPSSVWIEEGLDPDVTTFGFESGTQTEPSGPELAEDAIQRLVYSKQNDLMNCYATALEEDEELAGKVDFQFGVAPDGHVAMVKVTRSSLESKSTEDCMVAQARKWSFPPTNRSTLMKFDTDFTFAYE